MEKEIREWVNEISRLQAINNEQKKQLIEFSDYFEPSGKTEPYVNIDEKERRLEALQNIIEIEKCDDKLVRTYLKNPNLKVEDLAIIFGTSTGTVSRRITEYFNFKRKKRDDKNKNNARD